MNLTSWGSCILTMSKLFSSLFQMHRSCSKTYFGSCLLDTWLEWGLGVHKMSVWRAEWYYGSVSAYCWNNSQLQHWNICSPVSELIAAKANALSCVFCCEYKEESSSVFCWWYTWGQDTVKPWFVCGTTRPHWSKRWRKTQSPERECVMGIDLDK